MANLTAITGMLLNVGLMIVNDGLLWFGLFLRTGSDADGAASDTSVARGKDHGTANSGLRAREIDISLNLSAARNRSEVTSNRSVVALTTSRESRCSLAWVEDGTGAITTIGEITNRVDSELVTTTHGSPDRCFFVVRSLDQTDNTRATRVLIGVIEDALGEYGL